jgi:hypothetical protein
MYISMMEAYYVESLKKQGLTNNDIVSQLTTVVENEEVDALKALYERDQHQLEKAFNGQYKISFVTLNGLRNLLMLKFDIPLDSYRTEANGIYHLPISLEVEEQIRSFISINWTVKREGELVSFYVEGK